MVLPNFIPKWLWTMTINWNSGVNKVHWSFSCMGAITLTALGIKFYRHWKPSGHIWQPKKENVLIFLISQQISSFLFKKIRICPLKLTSSLSMAVPSGIQTCASIQGVMHWWEWKPRNTGETAELNKITFGSSLSDSPASACVENITNTSNGFMCNLFCTFKLVHLYNKHEFLRVVLISKRHHIQNISNSPVKQSPILEYNSVW